jgi:hypothetical protein
LLGHCDWRSGEQIEMRRAIGFSMAEKGKWEVEQYIGIE